MGFCVKSDGGIFKNSVFCDMAYPTTGGAKSPLSAPLYSKIK